MRVTLRVVTPRALHGATQQCLHRRTLLAGTPGKKFCYCGGDFAGQETAMRCQCLARRWLPTLWKGR